MFSLREWEGENCTLMSPMYERQEGREGGRREVEGWREVFVSREEAG
jgi:hypothetical protein